MDDTLENKDRYKFMVDSVFLIVCFLCCAALVVLLIMMSVDMYHRSNVQYISIQEIQNSDASQLTLTDGTEYYSWYDWDRGTGKVYLVTKVNGKVVSVTDAYGEDGQELYVRLS